MACVQFSFFMCAAIAVATNFCDSQTTEKINENAREYQSIFRMPNDTRVLRKISKRMASETEGNSGQSGVNSQVLTKIPRTSFSCYKLQNGYYADLEVNCQVFHICDRGRKVSFLCPQGTIFQQAQLICDWWFKVDCKQSPTFQHSRERLIEEDEKASKPGTTNSVHQYEEDEKPLKSGRTNLVHQHEEDEKPSKSGRTNSVHQHEEDEKPSKSGRTNLVHQHEEDEKPSKPGRTNSVHQRETEEIKPRDIQLDENYNYDGKQNGRINPYHESVKHGEISSNRDGRKSAKESPKYHVLPRRSRTRNNIRFGNSNKASKSSILQSTDSYELAKTKLENARFNRRKAEEMTRKHPKASSGNRSSEGTHDFVQPDEIPNSLRDHPEMYKRVEYKAPAGNNQSNHTSTGSQNMSISYQRYPERPSLITNQNSYYNENNSKRHLITGFGKNASSSNGFQEKTDILKERVKYVTSTTSRPCNTDNYTREASGSVHDTPSIRESIGKNDIGKGVRETPGKDKKPQNLPNDMIYSKSMYNVDDPSTASVGTTPSARIPDSIFDKNSVSRHESMASNPKAGKQNSAEKVQRSQTFSSNTMKGRSTYPSKIRNEVNVFQSLKDLEDKVPVSRNPVKLKNAIFNMSPTRGSKTRQPLALYFSVASDKYDAKELEDFVFEIGDEILGDNSTVSGKSDAAENVMDDSNMAPCNYYIHYLNIRETDKSLCDARKLKMDPRVESTTPETVDSYANENWEKSTTDFPGTTEFFTADNTLMYNDFVTQQTDYDSSTINVENSVSEPRKFNFANDANLNRKHRTSTMASVRQAPGNNTRNVLRAHDGLRSGAPAPLHDCNSSSSYDINNQNRGKSSRNKSTIFSEASGKVKIGNRDLNRNRMTSFMPSSTKAFVNSPNLRWNENQDSKEVNNRSTLSSNYYKEEEIEEARKFGITNAPPPNNKVPTIMNYESEVTTEVIDYVFEDFNETSKDIDALENGSEEILESVEIINVNMDNTSPRNSAMFSRESLNKSLQGGKQKNVHAKMEAASDSLLPSVAPTFREAPASTAIIKPATDSRKSGQTDRGVAPSRAKELFNNSTRITHSEIERNIDAKELTPSKRVNEEKSIPTGFTLLPVAFSVNDIVTAGTNLPATSNTPAGKAPSCSDQHGDAVLSVASVFDTGSSSNATLSKYVSSGKINDTCLSALMPIMKETDNKLVRRLIVLIISHCAEAKNKTI